VSAQAVKLIVPVEVIVPPEIGEVVAILVTVPVFVVAPTTQPEISEQSS